MFLLTSPIVQNCGCLPCCHPATLPGMTSPPCLDINPFGGTIPSNGATSTRTVLYSAVAAWGEVGTVIVEAGGVEEDWHYSTELP